MAWILSGAVVLFLVAAGRFGADSRDGLDWQRGGVRSMAAGGEAQRTGGRSWREEHEGELLGRRHSA
ncbi:MAG TPA: hypothetical protein VNF07_13690 [Acidimicrobiales bacterium]|nr:hypothetical protein [Acidimicrobiales bacterium]